MKNNYKVPIIELKKPNGEIIYVNNIAIETDTGVPKRLIKIESLEGIYEIEIKEGVFFND